MKLIYRAFRTRGVYLRYSTFRATIKQELEGPIATLIKKSLNKYTTNWKTRPGMEVGAIIARKGITLSVLPFGPGVENWRRVSWGVNGHWIQVKKHRTFRGFKKYKPALRLRRYRPTTTPGGRWGGPGHYSSAVAYRQRVWWPGIFPRNFEERTYREVTPEVRRRLENAARRGIRRARREGR